MKLNDFCHALESGQLVRAGWGCPNLSSQGIITRELAVDAEEWEMVLRVSADNGFRWEYRWTLFGDSTVIDPIRHLPLEAQVLLQGLGLGTSDMHTALMEAASSLTATGEWDDVPPRDAGERMHIVNRAIDATEAGINRWYRPLAQIHRDEDDVDTIARHTRNVTSMVLEVSGVAS